MKLFDPYELSSSQGTKDEQGAGACSFGQSRARFCCVGSQKEQRRYVGCPPKKYFASSNVHPPHSRAYDREHGCVNSSMVFEWLGALSTCVCVCVSNSTCLRADLENSNIGSVNKSQAPSKMKPDGGLNEVAYSQPKATQRHHPFRGSGCTQNTKAPT